MTFLSPPLCPSCGQPKPILEGAIILNTRKHSVETPEGLTVIRGYRFEMLQIVCEAFPEPVPSAYLMKRVWGSEGTGRKNLSSTQGALNRSILEIGLRVQTPGWGSYAMALLRRGPWEPRII